jgi:peptidyl-prolyl cis-trans isomerase D
LVGVIILPFVFWGMGDVFRGGNQNVVATVDSKKISTQEFMNYLRQINLNEDQIKICQKQIWLSKYCLNILEEK